MKKICIITLTLSLFFITLAVPAKMTTLTPLEFCSFEEYQAFIGETDLPENFVYYDSISMFGEFKDLTFCGMFSMYGYEPERMKYGGYEYGVKVTPKSGSSSDDGGRMYVQIRPIYDDYSVYYDKEKYVGELDDLLAGSGNSYYVFNEAIYLYRSGKLWGISWKNDGILYSIWPNLEYNEYAPDSIVGKLLNKNTAPEVIEMLKNYNFTGKPDEPEPPETADISFVFPLLGIISAGGFTLFAMKKRKK